MPKHTNFFFLFFFAAAAARQIYICEYHSLPFTPLSRNVYDDKLSDKCFCHKEQAHFIRCFVEYINPVGAERTHTCTTHRMPERTRKKNRERVSWYGLRYDIVCILIVYATYLNAMPVRPWPVTTSNLHACMCVCAAVYRAGCSQFITYLRCATLSFSCLNVNCFLNCSTLPSLSS